MAPDDPIEVKRARALQTYKAPLSSGLYAWYYLPIRLETRADSELAVLLSHLCDSSRRVQSTIRMDYGISLCADAQAIPKVGFESKSVIEDVESVVVSHRDAIVESLAHFMVPYFTRPIYIGIASKLRRRLFDDHVSDLQKYWEPDHRVSRLLERYRDKGLTVNELLEVIREKLGMGHSFALEARVRQFAPQDLVVYWIETALLDFSQGVDAEEAARQRRNVERLFQLISTPVCGRR